MHTCFSPQLHRSHIKIKHAWNNCNQKKQRPTKSDQTLNPKKQNPTYIIPKKKSNLNEIDLLGISGYAITAIIHLGHQDLHVDISSLCFLQRVLKPPLHTVRHNLRQRQPRIATTHVIVVVVAARHVVFITTFVGLVKTWSEKERSNL